MNLASRLLNRFIPDWAWPMTNLSLETSGDFRAIGLRPLNGDVDGSLNIGIANKTAGITGKPMLGTYPNPTATRTSLGRVAGINKDQRNAGLFGFVRYELPELKEGPTSHETAQSLTLAVGALTDALQVLQTDEAIGFLGKTDYALAYVVIQVFLESAFSSSQPFQGALCTFCASPLKRCLGAGKLLPLFIDLAPRKHKAGGSSCDAVYSQIHAERVSAGRDWGFGFNADVRIETIPAAVVRDSSWANLPALEQFALIFTQAELEPGATSHCRDCRFFCSPEEAKEVFVEDDTRWPELYGIPVGRYTVKHSDAIASREPILFPHIAVVESREREAVKHFQSVAVNGDFITGSRESNHSFRQCQSLIFSKNQFAFDGLNHLLGLYIRTMEEKEGK